MPGKVNPTQCEAVTMVCAQVKMRVDYTRLLLPEDDSCWRKISGLGVSCFGLVVGEGAVFVRARVVVLFAAS